MRLFHSFAGQNSTTWYGLYGIFKTEFILSILIFGVQLYRLNTNR